MNRRKVVFILLLTLSARAIAENAGTEEALFVNRSKQTLYCYGDLDEETICQVMVGPMDICRGDAIGGEIGTPFYKAPNSTQWDCFIDPEEGGVNCQGRNLRSSFVTAAAFSAKRFHEYYRLPWASWREIMGEKVIKKCTRDYKVISNVIWHPGDENCAPKP